VVDSIMFSWYREKRSSWWRLHPSKPGDDVMPPPV